MNLGATVNSPVDDRSPAFSPDGHWLFFASHRPGGFGGLDIYASYRPDVHDDFGWQAPTNLGPNVNDDAERQRRRPTSRTRAGRPQLFFGSGPARRQLGERDLYVSELQPDGTWGPATRMPELSSVFTETRPTIRGDGLEIFFHRGRSGHRATDLWVATRTPSTIPGRRRSTSARP